jgi:hypothetical protein
MTALARLLVLSATTLSAATTTGAVLPPRVQRVVLHTLGGPFYRDPAWRFRFLSPPETFARWKARFGAHWIVGTDGAVWPRHPRSGEPPSVAPPVASPPDAAWRERLAREAAPVYSHVQGANEDSVGIEIAHSGHSNDPFPEDQLRTVAWLVRALLALSHERLNVASVVGHKDLDPRPAYEPDSCRSGCPFYADDAGRPYRRRVDPPEGLFTALARQGLVIPREGREGDRELIRAEAVPMDRVPRLIR